MTSFLAGSLANAIAAGFQSKLLPGTLRKVTTASRDSVGDPVTTTADYQAQGLVDNYDAVMRARAGIPETDSKIVLIAGLCGAAPAIGDRVMFSSGVYAGQWWQARDVVIDPAGASYECQSFKVPA
jgi:hypothetical protein